MNEMPVEVGYVFAVFIAIAAVYFMYSWLRVNRKEGEVSSMKEDTKTVGKMIFRYTAIVLTFFICMGLLIAVEAQFMEPNKGVVSGDFFTSALAASFVGKVLKKKMGL